MTEQTLLIFDIDGTLCQTKEIGDNCFIDVFEKIYHCKLGNVDWENFENITDSALYVDLYKLRFNRGPTKTETTNFKKTYLLELQKLTISHNNSFKAVDGANEFLMTCEQNNYFLAIATGSWLDIALIKMNACELNHQNIPISSSDDDYRRTEIVKSAIEKSKHFYSKSNFTNITYVGDGLWDKKCCEQLEIGFIGVDIDNNQKLKQAGVKKVYPNFLSIEL